MSRIAVLAHTHPSITSGGAEISAYTLYRGLLEQGVDACFIAAVPESAMHRLRIDTPAEYAIGYRPEAYEPYYHLADPAVTADVLALLERLGCTAAVFHHFLNFGINTVGEVARRMPGRAVLVLHEFLAICHHHGQMVTRPALRLCEASSPAACATCFEDRDPMQFVVRRRHFQDACAHLAGFVSPSRFLKDRFVAWGLPEDAIAVIENGVPRLPGPEARVEAAAPRDAVTVGFFGQINPFKGVDLLLDAADRIARRPELAARLRLRVHGHLVGQSAAFDARFAKAVDTLPFLECAGPYQNDRVFELMRDCDYVLMASRWWENSPVVIQEAYACGRPLIVPGIGGMKEKIVDDVTGLHFRPGDSGDLVRAFDRAASAGTPERLRERLPEVATGRRMADAYLDFLATRAPAIGAAPANERPPRRSVVAVFPVPSGVSP
jgi:glycosyltransferase involved in cell wall biosynthesis